MCYDFNMHSDSLETGRVFRIAAWIWIGYLASLIVMDTLIYASRPISTTTSSNDDEISLASACISSNPFLPRDWMACTRRSIQGFN